MAEEAFVASKFVLAGLCCGAVVLAVVIGLAAAWFMSGRKSEAEQSELAELRKENAKLRDEVERLKKGPHAAGSADIQEL